MRLHTSTQLLSTIALISVLSLMTGMPLAQSVIAAPLAKPATMKRLAAGVPDSVKQAVLREVEQVSQNPVSSFQITQAQQQTWKNGCLGLAEPDVMCTQALVPGWQVEVKGPGQKFVFRSDRTGKIVKLDPQQTEVIPRIELPSPTRSQVQPTHLQSDEMPQPLSRGVVFRVISSGGFAGQTTQTILLSDGRILRTRVFPKGQYSSQLVERITLQEVNRFRQVLKQTSFDRYHRLNYEPTPGSADFITVTLSSPKGTVQYADSVVNELPPAIQTVISAWSKL